MRFFLFLMTCLLCAAPAVAADVQSTPLTRGMLPGDLPNQLPQPSQAQIVEAEGIRKVCEATVEKNYYDCTCLSITYLQLRVTDKKRGGNDTPTYTLQETARKSCANTVALAGMTYTRCSSWAPRLLDEPENFCTCYSNTFARKFAAKPAGTYAALEGLMSSALTDCDIGRPVRERQERKELVRQLKQTGEYETLFPGAIREKSYKPTPIPKGQRSTSQLLSDQMFEQGTVRQRSGE